MDYSQYVYGKERKKDLYKFLNSQVKVKGVKAIYLSIYLSILHGGICDAGFHALRIHQTDGPTSIHRVS